MMVFFQTNDAYDYDLNEYKNKYFNESLSDLVKNVTESDRIIEYNGELIQQFNAVFNDPEPNGFLDYRTHFFAPKKYFLGIWFDTFYFNIIVIWLMTVVLYAALYFELLGKGLSALGKIKIGGKSNS